MHLYFRMVVRVVPMLAALLIAACGAGTSSARLDAPVAAEPGDPLPGLTDEERTRFVAGKALFNRIFTPEEGLGPFFNENQCSACHTDPASGGTGEQVTLRASRLNPPDRCDLLPAHGGENVQINATPLLQNSGPGRRPQPPSATHLGRSIVPFLFGLGLIESVPDAVLLDAEDGAFGGRVGRDTVGAVARFGRKAEHATLDSFIANALIHEMGLTSPLHREELPYEGKPLPDGIDPTADPEIDASSFALLADYVRFLAPLSRRLPDDDDERAAIERGERLFAQLGCAECHTPHLETGSNPVEALDRKRIYLYSDLLLHDMGEEAGGACGIAAAPTEYRTEPLMGVGYRRRFLHDGRARTLLDAILQHGGEATAARAAFVALPRVDQEYLKRFLQSL